jgi:hypothetical protein
VCLMYLCRSNKRLILSRNYRQVLCYDRIILKRVLPNVATHRPCTSYVYKHTHTSMRSDVSVSDNVTNQDGGCSTVSACDYRRPCQWTADSCVQPAGVHGVGWNPGKLR